MKSIELKGSGLVDYVIPTAVVGLVLGLGLYYFSQNGSILTNLMASLKGYVGSKDNSMIIVKPQGSSSSIVNPGDLGGDHDNPVKSCNTTTNLCDIDYGDFILRGIPNDLNQHVNEVGGSRGGQVLAEMLSQTIAYMKETDPTNPDIPYLEEMKKAAYNMTNDMSAIESLIGGYDNAKDYCLAAVKEDIYLSLLYYNPEIETIKFLGPRALTADLSNFPTGEKITITNDLLNTLNSVKDKDPILTTLYNYANNVGVGNEVERDEFLVQEVLPVFYPSVVIDPDTGKDPIERIDLSTANLAKLPASYSLARTEYYFNKEANNLPSFIKDIVVNISTNMTSIKSNAASNAYIGPKLSDTDFQEQKNNLLHPTNTVDPNFINSLM